MRDQLVVVEELGAGPTSMAAFAIAHYAVIQVLAAHGTTDAHHDLTTRLVAGSTRGAFALSEPAGGTDVARVMRTRAARDGSGWRLTGQKLWTSGAAEAEAIVVLARTSPIDRSPVHGVTMFLVPRDAPGVEVRTIETFGVRGCSTCEVFLDDVVLDGRRSPRSRRPGDAPGLRDDRPRGPQRDRGLSRGRPSRARVGDRARDGRERCSAGPSGRSRHHSTGSSTAPSHSRRPAP